MEKTRITSDVIVTGRAMSASHISKERWLDKQQISQVFDQKNKFIL